jgi:hypothetical protein
MKNAKTAALIAVAAPRGAAPEDEGGTMQISTHTTRKLAQAIALAVIVAGLAVPAAAAGSGQPPDVFARAVARHQALPDVFERYVASHPYGAAAPATLEAAKPQGSTFITDTLGGNGHPQQAQGYRFITDTLGGNGHPKQVQGYRFITDTLAPGGGAPIEAAPSAPSFSWADAGLGAGTALGALLVLLGSALLVARRQGRLAI